MSKNTKKATTATKEDSINDTKMNALAAALSENPAITVPELKEVAAKATAPAIHDSIDEVLEELKAQAEPVKATAAKAKAKKTKEPKAKPEPIKFDLPIILAALPDEFTPSVLDKAFALNDGGKTVRRHLRNHFAEAMTHNKKDKWTFTKADAETIITYFASRYAFHADAIATKDN